jgi:predicted O-linked N-acetylglucosamine transferase (SPINDLY family)
MVTYSIADYGARAWALVRDRALLAEIRSKLARNRSTHPLFDTARFTRHLEAAYVRMVERQRNGEGPEAFAVQALGKTDG